MFIHRDVVESLVGCPCGARVDETCKTNGGNERAPHQIRAKNAGEIWNSWEPQPPAKRQTQQLT